MEEYDESVSDGETTSDKFKLNINAERSKWWNTIYAKYIPTIYLCLNCKKKSFLIINKNSIINPIIFYCNNHKCKSRHSFGYDIFFDKLPKAPASLLLDIIKWFIVDNSNAIMIIKNINNKYHLENYNTQTICNHLIRFD